MLIEVMETAEILKLIDAIIEGYSYDHREHGKEIKVLNDLYDIIVERSIF